MVSLWAERARIKCTITDRIKVSKILHDIRQNLPITITADILGIPHVYVSGAEHMTKNTRSKRELDYRCPAWAIKRILEWDKTQYHNIAVNSVLTNSCDSHANN